jgi:hypothetical protein
LQFSEIMTPCDLTDQHLRINMRPQFFQGKRLVCPKKKEAVACYETVVSVYQPARRHIPQCREIDNTAHLSKICCNITILCRYTYCETRLWWQRLIPFKASQLIPVVIFWKPRNIMKYKICTVTFAGVQFRV